ncbi:MAG: Wzz/FepE/Etk N-terminal domain-containing protein [Woeseiaceae bacterium]
MKNNNLQELNPVYIQEARYSSDDEISLIDLTMVLVNRKKLISLTITLFITIGIAAALLMPKKYTFSTSIEIGSQIISGNVSSFETTQTLLAKLQHSHIPQVLYAQRQTEPDSKKKYEIKANNPKGSNILVLSVKGTEAQADLLVKLLHSVNLKAIEDHSRIYDSVKRNMISRLNLANSELKLLKKTKNNETEISAQQDLIELYSSQLANLRNTREIQPPMKSIEPTGTSRKLIVIIAAFAGMFFGVFTAFFAEFASKVREKQNEVVSRKS